MKIKKHLWSETFEEKISILTEDCGNKYKKKHAWAETAELKIKKKILLFFQEEILTACT